ncbi:MAG: hypothetical protein ACKO8Q_08530 [Bacteroidota bacterium]
MHFQFEAQVSINSPFTRFGIGFTDQAFNPRTLAMGGAGVALASDFNLQLNNPASFSFMKETTFQGGFYSKRSSLENKGSSQNFWGGQIGELGFGFKRTQSKWGFAMGLRPESQVGYKFENSSVLNDSTTATYSYSGEGGFSNYSLGLSRVFLFHTDSAKLNTHSISIGANFNYRFGSILRIDRVNFNNSTIYNSKVTNRIIVNDANPTFGLLYNFPLFQRKDKGKVLKSTMGTLAATYEITNNCGIELQDLRQLTRNVSGVEVLSATILDSTNENLSIEIPFKLEFGASIRHEFKKSGALVISANYRTQNWLNSGNSLIQVSNQSFHQSKYSGIGMEFQPNTSGVRNKILGLGLYRIGAYDHHLYFGINNAQVRIQGLTAGAQFPLTASKTASSIYFSLEFSRVNPAISEIKETSISGQLGFVLRPFEKWFLRRKYD